MSNLAVLGAFAALSLLLYWPVFDIRPFHGDNLQILEWADGARLSDLPGAFPRAYPEWRPLSYATVWLQYRWGTFQHLRAYYIVNVLLWAACGWLVYRIGHVLSHSAAAGLAAGAIVLTSTQLISSLVLIEERQSSLACFFGLAAWLMIIGGHDTPASRLRWLGVSLLLAASALSKEYGLAFAGAVAVFGILERLWPAAAAAIAAVALYVGLRIGFAGGALAPYCEEHGYFFVARSVCIDTFNAQVGTQVAYNIIATGVASLLPGIFFDDGTINISPRWLMVSILFLAIAILGWARGPRSNRLGMLVVGFNTALSFLLYRSRNHVVALCAVSVAVGVGLPIASAALRRVAPAPSIRALAVATLLAILTMRALVMHQLLSDRVEMASRPEACSNDMPDLDRAFMARIWRHYDLQLPECPGADSVR